MMWQILFELQPVPGYEWDLSVSLPMNEIQVYVKCVVKLKK